MPIGLKYSGMAGTTVSKPKSFPGGPWLSNFGENEGRATYQLQIPEAGMYTLWVRANPTKSRLSGRMDEGAWEEVDTDQAEHVRNVAEGGAVDLRYIGWMRLGERSFSSGEHRLAFKFHSQNRNHGALDAIYLTSTDREPAGKGRPEEEARKHAPGYFPWAPLKDPLTGDSPIDLRDLNEREAGQSGFVRRQADHIVLGNGEPVRFWMVQGGLGDERGDFARRARRLAKYGRPPIGDIKWVYGT